MATNLGGFRRGLDKFMEDIWLPVATSNDGEAQRWEVGYCENKMLGKMGLWPDPA